MEPSQHEDRDTAAKEFLQSLEELEDILQENPTENEETETTELHTANNTSDSKSEENLTEIDLAAFEDAVADIEQYLEGRKK